MTYLSRKLPNLTFATENCRTKIFFIMPLLEIQDNSREKPSLNNVAMATIDIACNGLFGETQGESASLPHSRCNSWRERHTSKHSSRRRRSSPRLTRTNSASMPDCSSNSSHNNKNNNTNTTTNTALGLSNSYSNCSVCMVRSFKTTSKGDVLNTGSFCKVPSANSLRSSGSLNTSHSSSADTGSRRISEDRGRAGSIDSNCGDENKHARLLPAEVPNICVTPSYFRTLVLGSTGVGKTSLVQQFTRADDPHHNGEPYTILVERL